MATVEQVIELHLAGDSITPGLVRSRDLAEVIEAVENMIASLVERDFPETKKEEIVVGLTQIQAGSVRLHFATP